MRYSCRKRGEAATTLCCALWTTFGRHGTTSCVCDITSRISSSCIDTPYSNNHDFPTDATGLLADEIAVLPIKDSKQLHRPASSSTHLIPGHKGVGQIEDCLELNPSDKLACIADLSCDGTATKPAHLNHSLRYAGQKAGLCLCQSDEWNQRIGIADPLLPCPASLRVDSASKFAGKVPLVRR
jgi:hypothetical protein